MDDPTILVVDDEQSLADLYATWIDDDYRTVTVYGGEAALAAADEEPVDIVLLDRHMPGLSGDEVLRRLRDRGEDAWVTVVTAVDPEPSVLELPCNNYVVKPLGRAQLNRMIETIRIRAGVDALREHVSLANKLEVVEREHDADDLADSEQYQRAIADLKRLADSVAEEGARRRAADGPEGS